MRRATSLILFLSTFCLTATSLTALGNSATLKGRVVDVGGTGIPGVVIALVSKSEPSGSKKVVTDVEGNYSIAPLPPTNDYYLKVDYPGFAALEVGPLDLDPGRTTIENLTLHTTEELITRLEITSQADMVDVDNGIVRSVFTNEFLDALPMIGHTFQDALAFVPGVTDTDGDGNVNVNGARDTGLQINLDGSNVTDPVSGTFGQNFNQDIIEELEVITSGADAQFGRTDGGFANIITKSGGNEFAGKFSFFWQGRFLNGNGANNNDVNQFESDFPSFRDLRPTLSLGGAIVRDKVWYFISGQLLDTERPVNQIGSDILVTSRGSNLFGKLTWQVDLSNQLSLQVAADPLTFRGLGLALGVSPESDVEFSQGGVTPSLKWVSTISPHLLLESTVSAFHSGISLTPVSELFEPTRVRRVASGQSVQALYPCEVVNCDPARGERKMFQRDLITGAVTGPFNQQTDDSRIRNSLRTDLSYNIDDVLGQHSIKAGIEFADEKFEDEPITNPLLIDVTTPFNPPPSSGGGGAPVSGQIAGQQVLQTFDPVQTPQRASSFNTGIFAQDSWKPIPNLTVNLGIRLDREDIDTSGFDEFDPRQERRGAIKLWREMCGVIRDQGLETAASNCHDPLTYDGNPPKDYSDDLRVNDPTRPPVPSSVAALDVDGDGYVRQQGADAAALLDVFTQFLERESSNFEVTNNNLSPRFGISWDPWGDGRTKLFGTWSRFYDRLFLSTVTGEIGPDTVNFTFEPNTNHVINPGAISRAASTVSIAQIDRDIRTPHTDEISLGIERELAPEWSIALTWISRHGYDLLQDTDLNHITCEQHDDVLGIDPALICGEGTNLETDKFGRVGFAPGTSVTGGNFSFDRAFSVPNGAPDLYTISNGFNQVLRTGNYNSSKFTAYELRVIRRLHRNWQMQASYTWSKAFGQAEAFGSPLGNDPQTVDDEEGYLAFDQRHVLKFQGVTRLARDISLGAVVQWASGTPYSIIHSVVDQDSTGNTIFRQFFPSSQRNDQRNEGQWRVDTRIEKNFTWTRLNAAAFLSVQNLLNSDELTVTTYDVAALNGVGLNAVRDFGRRFELGVTVNF